MVATEAPHANGRHQLRVDATITHSAIHRPGPHAACAVTESAAPSRLELFEFYSIKQPPPLVNNVPQTSEILPKVG